MPNLPTHLEFALEVSNRLDSPLINAHLGSFLLGATAPDIRVITRVDRSAYHFVQLDFKSVGEGIDNMFKSHPFLSDVSSMDVKLQAFISGYITHLIADECWVTEVFRKYFASEVIFPDVNEGLILAYYDDAETRRRQRYGNHMPHRNQESWGHNTLR